MISLKSDCYKPICFKIGLNFCSLQFDSEYSMKKSEISWILGILSNFSIFSFKFKQVIFAWICGNFTFSLRKFQIMPFFDSQSFIFLKFAQK